MMVIGWENWNSEWEIGTRFTYGHSARLSIVSTDRVTAPESPAQWVKAELCHAFGSSPARGASQNDYALWPSGQRAFCRWDLGFRRRGYSSIVGN